MALATGTRLGPYEVTAQLGAGGMGEVYRARDAKLNRDVAVKILPSAFTADSDRLSRFEREARVLGALNHPHIGAIYGFEDSGEVHALVLELVEGDTLSEHIARGLTLDESLSIARQIADALEAAHERGVVHRDLKPANVKITPDGVVKVLDFGLAKVDEAVPGAASHSPTLIGATRAGMLLGTAQYMSPEQVRAKPVDKRADIWAFGCVLYEMLTRRRAFDADNASDIIVAILEREPDWSALPGATPLTIRRLLERCLKKDSRQRLRDIGDARLEIEAARTGGAAAPAAVTGPPPLRGIHPLIFAVAVVAVAAASAAAGWVLRGNPGAAPPRPLKRFVIDTRATPLNQARVPLALSPDGTKLAYSSGSYEASQLFVRSFDQREPRLLTGTTSAFDPFFSPDGRWVAFWASTGLKKVPVNGGPVVAIASLGAGRRGIFGSWSPDGRSIVFARDTSGVLWRVGADGGEPEAITTLTTGEAGHLWPAMLPTGKALLFTTIASTAQEAYRVAVQPLDSKTHRTLIEGGSFARYLPTGHLLYSQAGTVFAVPFDASRLEVTGQATPVLEGVSTTDLGNSLVSVADDGTVAYVEAVAAGQRSLVWVDRRGTVVSEVGSPRAFKHPSLSPDGKRVVVEIVDGARQDLWISELSSRAFTRFTSEGPASFPIWTPGGDRVIFATTSDGKTMLRAQTIDASRPAETLVSNPDGGVWPGSWTPDGRTLAMMWSTTRTGGDIDVLTVASAAEPKPVVNTAATEWGAKLSPHGKWLAYISNESGRWEVFLQPYPGPGARRQISTEGGTEIVWARSGRELFFRNGQRMMAVQVAATPTLSIGAPQTLFEGTFLPGSPGAHNYDVSLDGQQFLMVRGDQEATRPIHVMLNWFDEVIRRVGSR